jgi:hypothetical protein
MAFDFGTLAGSIGTGLPGVRACLLVSRDGLPLSSHPESAEARAMKAWAQLQNLGDVDKGFVGMTDEMWVFVRRGPFAALVLAEPNARPGVLLTTLDQALMAADEERVRSRSDLRSAVREETSPRFRAPLHRDPERAPRDPDRVTLRDPDRVASGSATTPPAAPSRPPLTLPEPDRPVPRPAPEARPPERPQPERPAPGRTQPEPTPAEGLWPRTTARPPAPPRPAPDRAPPSDRAPTPEHPASLERPVRAPAPDRPAGAPDRPAGATERTSGPEPARSGDRSATRPSRDEAYLEVDPVELAREFGGLYAEGEE